MITEQEQHKFSALFDQELSDQDALQQLENCDEQQWQCWHRYAMVRQVLQHEAVAWQADFADNVADQIANEATFSSTSSIRQSESVATRSQGQWAMDRLWPMAKWAGATVLATLVALSTILVIIPQRESERSQVFAQAETAIKSDTMLRVTPVSSTPTILTNENGIYWDSVSPKLGDKLNGYLVNHSQYVPAGGMRPYVHIVGYNTELDD